MSMQRRHFIALAASAMGVAAAPAQAAAGPLPISALGVDAGQFGVRPGSADDDVRVLCLVPAVCRGDLRIESEPRGGLRHVERLAVVQGAGELRVVLDDDVGDALLDEPLGDGAARHAAADDGHLPA